MTLNIHGRILLRKGKLLYERVSTNVPDSLKADPSLSGTNSGPSLFIEVADTGKDSIPFKIFDLVKHNFFPQVKHKLSLLNAHGDVAGYFKWSPTSPVDSNEPSPMVLHDSYKPFSGLINDMNLVLGRNNPIPMDLSPEPARSVSRLQVPQTPSSDSEMQIDQAASLGNKSADRTREEPDDGTPSESREEKNTSPGASPLSRPAVHKPKPTIPRVRQVSSTAQVHDLLSKVDKTIKK